MTIRGGDNAPENAPESDTTTKAAPTAELQLSRVQAASFAISMENQCDLGVQSHVGPNRR